MRKWEMGELFEKTLFENHVKIVVFHLNRSLFFFLFTEVDTDIETQIQEHFYLFLLTM